MKKILLVLFAIAVSLSAAYAANPGKTLMAAADPYPPFVDQENPTDGLSLEITRAALGTEGYTVKMQYVPWARAVDGVKRGTYDIIPDIWMTEERQKSFMFSDPYAANQIKFIKRKGDPFEFDGLKSLTGKTVGTILGYGYSDDFLKAENFKTEPVPTLIQNIRKLLSNRIDLTIEDEITASAAIKQHDASILPQIEFTKSALSKNNLYIAVGFENPRHKEIIGAFNRGLAKIKKDGTYAKIFAKYGITVSE